MNIVLLGIQGSGKGTLVELLKSKFDFDLVSVGQLLRDEVATGSALGKHINELQTKGVLVDIDIVMETLKKKLASVKSLNVIFDGFPRNLQQAEELDNICKVDKVIYLKLSKRVAMKRMLGRLTCKKCGFITNKMQAKTDVCPQCGGKLEVRSDDTVAGIKQRFQVYETETLPIVKRYKKAGVLVKINANKTPEQILENVLKVL